MRAFGWEAVVERFEGLLRDCLPENT